MQKSIKYMALGLVVIGIILAWMAFMLTGPSTEAKPAVQANTGASPSAVQRAVVARHALEAGRFLTADDVELRDVPLTVVGAVSDVSAVVGRGMAASMAEGDAITASSLLRGISGMLRPGERAVSIKVDESTAVGHKVQPGDWVDVLVVFRKDGQEVPDTQARRLLERRRVLAYGLLTHEPRPGPSANGKKDEGVSKADAAAESLNPTQPARTAVLAVRADEVSPLLLAERQGQVMLALRNPLEAVSAVAEGEAASAPVITTLQATTSATDVHQVVTLARLAEHSGSAASAKVVPTLARPVPLPVQRIPVVSKPRPNENANAVEMIRGVRTETVRY